MLRVLRAVHHDHGAGGALPHPRRDRLKVGLGAGDIRGVDNGHGDGPFVDHRGHGVGIERAGIAIYWDYPTLEPVSPGDDAGGIVERRMIQLATDNICASHPGGGGIENTERAGSGALLREDGAVFGVKEECDITAARRDGLFDLARGGVVTPGIVWELADTLVCLEHGLEGQASAGVLEVDPPAVVGIPVRVEEVVPDGLLQRGGKQAFVDDRLLFEFPLRELYTKIRPMLDFRKSLFISTLNKVLKRLLYPLDVMLLWQSKRRYFSGNWIGWIF